MNSIIMINKSPVGVNGIPRIGQPGCGLLPPLGKKSAVPVLSKAP